MPFQRNTRSVSASPPAGAGQQRRVPSMPGPVPSIAETDRGALLRLKRRPVLVSTALASVCVLIVVGCLVYCRLPVTRQPAVMNPFNSSIVAATKFTLYYPKELPSGYRIDTRSVTTPQLGVVVLDIDNSEGQKIYMSQEPRPSEFNFGGYYKDFTSLHEEVTSKGTVASGYINDDQIAIGSLVINGTWVIINSSSRGVTPNSLVVLLKSLVSSQ